MFDKEKLSTIKSGQAFQTPQQSLVLDSLSITELLALRDEIEQRMPATALKDMDLEKELVLQMQVAKALQAATLDDEATPANQKAQVLNAVASTLQNLIAMQTKFHTAERFKEIEGRLIRALEKVPNNYLEEFFKWYESEQ